ncbi:hypothetical protein GLYMA_03G200300v4 [Glycine max]|uniref:Uncharacterized protein n=1 Tax=Glycine max TaxID=3847 RepID=A0A0R0KM48_SOYBN|nr:hypothetical protein GYH30_007801 [Glycine max]KRH67984.1 hypothetical protein GLYMA_03G200300v4 [Glycine max]
MCHVTLLKYWRFNLMLLHCMFCLFLETQVLFYSTRTLWNFYMSCWRELLLSQLLAMFLTQERTWNMDACFLYKNKSITRLTSSERNWKMLRFLYYWLDTLLVHTYLLKCSRSRQRRSQVLAAALSYLTASLGLLPVQALRFLVRKSLGKSWSANAVEAACSHLSQYHTMRNVLYMAMTEFRKLSEAPDWIFMRERKAQLAFLFGVDDHWGPLHLLEEISKHVPGMATYIERENHTHGFCCTEAGSLWVAQHVVNLIKNQMACSNQ